MKAVLQRVSEAQITINHSETKKIGQGLVVLIGVMSEDTTKNAEDLAKKIANLRIFTDENDKMNLSLIDIKGSALVVSNFTLGADCKKGNRPSFTLGAKPDEANKLYKYFIKELGKYDINKLKTGEFGADMQINLINDGPVTIILDM